MKEEFTGYSDSLAVTSFAVKVVEKAGEGASLSELLGAARELVEQSDDKASLVGQLGNYGEFFREGAGPTEMWHGHSFHQWDRVFNAIKLENQCDKMSS